MSVTDRWAKLGGLAGIVGVVLILVCSFLPGIPPQPGDSNAAVRAYFSDHQSAILLTSYLGGLAGILVLWFVAAVRSVLRQAGPNAGTLADTAAVGGVIFVALIFLAFAFTATIAVNPSAEVRDDSVLRYAFDLSNICFTLGMFPWALFTAAASVGMVSTGVFPRLLGWGGLAVAAIMLVAALGVAVPSGVLAAGGFLTFAAFLVGLAWILVSSVLLLRPRAAAIPGS